MGKIAKLVAASVLTRVIVEEGATDQEVWEAAKPRLVKNLIDNGMDNLEDIMDDTECPFGILKEDKL